MQTTTSPTRSNRKMVIAAFLVGALAGAIACGSSSPASPSLAGATVYAQSVPTTDTALSFPSGAGMSEQGDWLFIRARAAAQCRAVWR
jgi:hypothetical protein